MSPERFAQILAAYGADPARWPEPERAAALSYAATHGAPVREALGLDRALGLYEAPLDVDAFVMRALADAPAPPRARAPILRVPLGARGAIPALALAASALLGVLLGFGAGAAAPADDAYQSVSAAFGVISAGAFEDGDG